VTPVEVVRNSPLNDEGAHFVLYSALDEYSASLDSYLSTVSSEKSPVDYDERDEAILVSLFDREQKPLAYRGSQIT
jgi:hypothetical protein